MNKCCSGCGVLLQNEYPDKIGYTPKIDALLCQRCFRIRHYGDHVISMKQGIDSDKVLKQVASMDAMVLWVVDLFDFEANLVKGLNKHLMNKKIVMVATKRDLLPDTLSDQKLITFIRSRLKQEGIKVAGIVLSGSLPEKDESSIEAIKEMIECCRDDLDVVVMGMANAGKSTLLNAINENVDLTCSLYPGTTLDMQALDMGEYKIYDTPGLTRNDSLLTNIDDQLLKQVVPLKAIKPRVYQIYEEQSLAIAGLVRIDLKKVKNASVVIYASGLLKIHRGKQKNADELWLKHYGELLSPTISQLDKMKKFTTTKQAKQSIDVVIHGLGWICISGDAREIDVWVSEASDVTFRKAMI